MGKAEMKFAQSNLTGKRSFLASGSGKGKTPLTHSNGQKGHRFLAWLLEKGSLRRLDCFAGWNTPLVLEADAATWPRLFSLAQDTRSLKALNMEYKCIIR